MKKETVNKITGEILDISQFNKVIINETRRPDGSLDISQDFQNCPSMAEQDTGHLGDVNWLVANYQVDQLDAYLSHRASLRPEILGHDFSVEPELTQAHNIALNLKKNFESLDEEIKKNFKNHVEFLKFIDNPANAEKMLKMGLMTKREIQNNQTQIPTQNQNQNQNSNQTIPLSPTTPSVPDPKS